MRTSPETVIRAASAEIQCPHCGHELSMFHEPEPGTGEQLANTVAGAVASWKFPLVLFAGITVWVVINISSTHPPTPTETRSSKG